MARWRAGDTQAHERKLPINDRFGRALPADPYEDNDGLWTRNVNGYDLADVVCQPCVQEDCRNCEVSSHTFTGWSGCACNNDALA